MDVFVGFVLPSRQPFRLYFQISFASVKFFRLCSSRKQCILPFFKTEWTSAGWIILGEVFIWVFWAISHPRFFGSIWYLLGYLYYIIIFFDLGVFSFLSSLWLGCCSGCFCWDILELSNLQTSKILVQELFFSGNFLVQFFLKLNMQDNIFWRATPGGVQGLFLALCSKLLMAGSGNHTVFQRSNPDLSGSFMCKENNIQLCYNIDSSIYIFKDTNKLYSSWTFNNKIAL